MTGLEAADLDAGYRGRAVLRDVSLAVRPGEVLALLGPNGSGKTTLLRALARLLEPARGCVRLDGVDLWSRGPRWAARQAALAPQNRPADWPLTVSEAVALGRAAHRGWVAALTADDRAAVDRALARLDLVGLRDRPVTELSGGEGQRVVLARALAREPRALLFDEPTAHLDLRHQVELLDLLRRLSRTDGLAVVLALHDLNQAAAWADRLALLDGGQLRAAGPPAEVLTPALIGDVYGVRVSVTTHPVHGGPLVTPVVG
jgi:iron complex transport system ATP-binding protein